VLADHPDKQMGAEAAEQRVAQKQQADEEGGEDEEAKPADEEVDEMFKAITEAFELLSDAKRRRDFDSLDDFDDSLPPKDYSAATHGDFFATFGPVFERNSRWSELPNAPLLGAADGAFDDVAAFYNFWFAFKSWRDFADADECATPPHTARDPT
jgi:DnaJ family protein C protein 2